jgi:hypothetical protein
MNMGKNSFFQADGFQFAYAPDQHVGGRRCIRADKNFSEHERFRLGYGFVYEVYPDILP